MSDGVLYERSMAQGAVVRIRRTSADGVAPVTAVLEVDRRAGTSREGIGNPPPLLHCEAHSESEVLAALTERAADDRKVAELLRDKGAR